MRRIALPTLEQKGALAPWAAGLHSRPPPQEALRTSPTFLPLGRQPGAVPTSRPPPRSQLLRTIGWALRRSLPHPPLGVAPRPGSGHPRPTTGA
eukprot:6622454-Alexandrium_andersonii.AAC.1